MMMMMMMMMKLPVHNKGKGMEGVEVAPRILNLGTGCRSVKGIYQLCVLLGE
jgi:hypothetical protein